MAIKRIIVKGTALRDEDIAIAAITPGHLVEQVAAGVRVHSSAAENAVPTFAVEMELVGNGIDVDYAALDTVLLAHPRSGDVINALLPASADAIVRGDFLESNGDGTLVIAATAAATTEAERAATVAVAEEAVDNSMGGTEVRILVRII
jgi:hypothetical protein